MTRSALIAALLALALTACGDKAAEEAAPAEMPAEEAPAEMPAEAAPAEMPAEEAPAEATPAN